MQASIDESPLMNERIRINSSGEVVTMVGTNAEIHAMMRPCPECSEVDCVCPDLCDEE